MTNKDYWENRWQQGQTGWDLAEVSPPIKAYIDANVDVNKAILIPGCGNAHEAEYLLQLGFTNVTVIDIAPLPVLQLKEKLHLAIQQGKLKVLCEDFFTHKGVYDLILEQTFFCAINPSLRTSYATHMHELLKWNGKLVGVLFDKQFDGGPPFGGTTAEYLTYFTPLFSKVSIIPCINSVLPRMGSEAWIELIK
ncbi:MAG: SAM-dependent methyltransferase [Bacteroidetes bacterium]|nr:MAG: SAM-dependent methyltransferase [Bacteroidota bacterium]